MRDEVEAVLPVASNRGVERAQEEDAARGQPWRQQVQPVEVVGYGLAIGIGILGMIIGDGRQNQTVERTGAPPSGLDPD